eukprot:CAMPEP_0177652862 /NCGR_PEP_ID=MMETSP0447-20121125/13387_1 /TAXON_ID=0 /ORGANISM="Stygamoeba regulata, Strain BSH-02190019" /LENGTH=176 /DNA_ID=CAMNT_0019156197 /DNA_START=84 /DNA_END=614 /DNA_ORIENTATION=-
MSVTPWLQRAVATLREIKALGLKESILRLHRYAIIRPGTLVGVDALGNKYYEDTSYTVGRDRWVIFPGADLDPTQVTAEWYGWLHHMTDTLPTLPEAQKYRPVYEAPHIVNVSGTKASYLPPNHQLSDKWHLPERDHDRGYEEWSEPLQQEQQQQFAQQDDYTEYQEATVGGARSQ